MVTSQAELLPKDVYGQWGLALEGAELPAELWL